MFTHVLDAFVPIKDFVEFLCIKVMSILVIFHEISESEISDHPVAVSGRQAELFLELIVNSYFPRKFARRSKGEVILHKLNHENFFTPASSAYVAERVLSIFPLNERSDCA